MKCSWNLDQEYSLWNDDNQYINWLAHVTDTVCWPKRLCWWFHQKQKLASLTNYFLQGDFEKPQFHRMSFYWETKKVFLNVKKKFCKASVFWDKSFAHVQKLQRGCSSAPNLFLRKPSWLSQSLHTSSSFGVTKNIVKGGYTLSPIWMLKECINATQGHKGFCV